jgi:HAD superfamily hydrolase (TIGR01509 family)
VVIAVLPAVVVTALLVDCDGVLADTERYGHLPAFNLMFDELGVPAHWSEDEYAEKLKIGGGKERMASMFREPGFTERAGVPDDEAARKDLLARWHKAKTAHFKQLVASGAIPPRSGIHRIVHEALHAGWTVAVCSTSAEESVRAVFERAVGTEAAEKCTLFCGDIVPAKKPAPDIYLLAVEKLGLDKSDTLVVEDSRNGLLAATAAGLSCVVTVNGYTRDEDMSEAILVVSELGDPDGAPIEVLANRGGAKPGDFITLDDLRACLSASVEPPHPPEGAVHDPEEGDPAPA